MRLARVAPFLPPSLSPVPRPWPNPLGCLAARSHPSSCVYTPPGRQQPRGAGPLDPHPSGDRFVRLARVAPFPPPSPVPRPRPIPLGCRAAPSHPSSRVHTPPGRQQPCGAGPLVPHPSGDRFVRLARVAPLPPAPLSSAVSLAVPVTRSRRVALATRPFLSRLLVVLRGVVRVCFLFFFVLFSAWFPPPCMHAQQHCIAICLGSVRRSRRVPPPSCGSALGGPRPCRATQPFSPRCCTCIRSPSSLPSPPLCLPPALLVLFSCSVCSPLVVSAPWLYLARPHVPQGLRPVFRPVGRPGRPPQSPLWGDSPVLLSRRPPLHQFPDGRAGRPVRVYAGLRHGASL